VRWRSGIVEGFGVVGRWRLKLDVSACFAATGIATEVVESASSINLQPH
jgi:hypothetical protein